MIRAERFNLITNLANEMDIITLDELAERLQVSVATVRRDVDELCSQGIVEKTRGGIIFCNKKTDSEPSLQLLQSSEHGRKKAHRTGCIPLHRAEFLLYVRLRLHGS